MSRRAFERGTALLAALDAGQPAPRPTYEAAKRQRGSQFGTCTCGAQVIWASLPSGSRAPLELDDATGDLCLENGVAVEWSTALGEHKRRFRLHFSTCPERKSKR